jgi:predicted NBD/HSP70 family sugar kinase
LYGLKHQKEKRSMDHFAGLDVSVKETSVCIVDETGKVVREVKVASEPEALLSVLKNPAYRFKRIGLGSRTAVAVAVQRSRRSRVTGGLC